MLLICVLIVLHSGFKPKQLTWVALGDSITYLNDHQNETGNRITKGYMTMAAEKMPELKYTNKGYNGWTATRIAADIEKLGVDLYHEPKMNHRKLVHFKRLKDLSTGQYKDYRYPAFIDIPFDPQKDEYPYPKEAINVTYDGLHPSDKGYAFITSKLLAVFKKINFQQ
jgi:lysophospholipase L1-like esterase